MDKNKFVEFLNMLFPAMFESLEIEVFQGSIYLAHNVRNEGYNDQEIFILKLSKQNKYRDLCMYRETLKAVAKQMRSDNG